MIDTRNAAVGKTAASNNSILITNDTTFSRESKEVSENNLSPVIRTPIRFRCSPNTIPQTLKQMDNWVLSAWNKQPISPVYYCPTSPTDVSKAVPFQQAIKAMDIEKCMGLGFILSDNVVVVDVDSCLDKHGTPNELAQKLMNQLNTYVEYSQSKQGLHFIFKDSQASEVKSRKGIIEIYTKEHYFALTGWKIEGKPNDIQTLDGMSQELIDKYFPPLGYDSDIDESRIIQTHTYTPMHSNEEVLQQMKHDDKFQRLFYEGNIEGYPSQSEADGALMLKLAQATYLCAPQMRELFSQSALGKRDKWNDPWYQDYVISGSIQYAKSNEVNPSSLAVFTLITFNDSINLTDQIFTYAAICKNDIQLMKYYEEFRKYCKQHKQQLGISMSEFTTQVKLAESRLELEQIEQHNHELDKLETLTLPAPYNTKNWIIPEGYKVNIKGTWVMSSTGYKKICNAAIFITQEVRHYITRDIKNQLFVFSPSEGWQVWDFIENRVLNNASLISMELSSKISSINSTNCQQLVKYLDEFRIANYNNIQHIMSTDKIGWIENEFVTPYNHHKYVLETTNNNFAKALQLKGTFEEWRQIAIQAWNYSSTSRFIMTMGFASVLLKPLKSRNFCLYLWARSTLKKSTIYGLTASIWGTSDIMVNLGGTLNGFEGEAVERDGFVYIIDEKQQVRDTFDPTKVIMKLANGMGDARATKDGTPKPRKTWKLIGILNGEEPLLDEWSTNGAFTRSITIHVTTDIIPPEFKNEVWDHIIDQNCGWAGQRFVDVLHGLDFEQLKQEKNAVYQQLKQEFPHHHDDHIAYVSLAIVAERLVNKYVFNQQDNSIQTARDILNGIEVKQALDNAEMEWDHLKSWLSTEVKHFKNNPAHIESMYADSFYGEYKKDCLVIVKSVLAEEFERWSRGRLKIEKVLDDLHEAGYVVGYPRTDKNLISKTWKITINGTKNVQAVKINKTLLESDK